MHAEHLEASFGVGPHTISVPRIKRADDIDPDSGNLIIGSVAICEKRAEEQAAEYGHSVIREVCYLALHGILHCFGYDHIEKADEEEMTALAEKIMNKINLTRDIV